MLKLNEVRVIYPEYNDMSDFELTRAAYKVDGAGRSFEEFARDFGGPAEQARPEEPGFLEKAWNSAGAIAEGIGLLPGQVWDVAKNTYYGGDIDASDRERINAWREQQAKIQEYERRYDGGTFEGVPGAMGSMGYSLATLGPSLAGRVIGAGLGAVAGGPAGAAAGIAAGMAGAGAIAYRATKEEFMQRLLQATEEGLGRQATPEEWREVADRFDKEATEYGVWEAVPEAIGNAIFAALLKPLGAQGFRDGLKKLAMRYLGAQAEEQTTETATQYGQGAIDAKMGFRKKAPTLPEAFMEQAPTTFWMTNIMGAGHKAAETGYHLAKNRLARKAEETGANLEAADGTGAPEREAVQAGGNDSMAEFENQFGDPSWQEPETREDRLRREWDAAARAGGYEHLLSDNIENPQEPAQGQPLYGDVEQALDFTRWIRNRQAAHGGALGPVAQGLAGGITLQQRMDNGNQVDLLEELNPDADLAQYDPEIVAHYRSQGFEGPDLRDALQADYANRNTLERRFTPENIRYFRDQGFEGSGLEDALMADQANGAAPIGGIMAKPFISPDAQMAAYSPSQRPISQQAAPVLPMPTQSQITNTQAAPRADTTAQAERLGLPAPNALPIEAAPIQGRRIAVGPALQDTRNLKPMPMGLLQGIAAQPAQAARPAIPQNQQNQRSDFFNSHIIVGASPTFGNAEARARSEAAADAVRNEIMNGLGARQEDVSGAPEPTVADSQKTDAAQPIAEANVSQPEGGNERKSYGKIPTSSGNSDVYVEDGEIWVGARRMTAQEAREFVHKTGQKYGHNAAATFQPLKNAAKAIEDDERVNLRRELGGRIDQDIEAGRKLDQAHIFNLANDILKEQKPGTITENDAKIHARQLIHDRLAGAMKREADKGGGNLESRLDAILELAPKVITKDRLDSLKACKRNQLNKYKPENVFRNELPLVAKVKSGVIHKTEDMTAIQAAQKWIRENILESIKTRIGEIIVDAKGIKDSMGHSMYPAKLDAVQAIEPVLEKGDYLGSLPDNAGHAIDNHYFAGRVNIGDAEKIVFVRARQANGGSKRFYVHEVFTEDEIREAGENIRPVNSGGQNDSRFNPESHFKGPHDFYKNLIAQYLAVKEGQAGERRDVGAEAAERWRKPGETYLGRNEKGEAIFINQSGLRRYDMGGISGNQPVQALPDGSQKFETPEQLYQSRDGKRYLTDKEIDQFDKAKPEKPLEHWSRAALLAELGGATGKYRKASKPELVKAIREMRARRESASNPTDMFMNAVNEDRLNSLTVSELNMVNNMFNPRQASQPGATNVASAENQEDKNGISGEPAAEPVVGSESDLAAGQRPGNDERTVATRSREDSGQAQERGSVRGGTGTEAGESAGRSEAGDNAGNDLSGAGAAGVLRATRENQERDLRVGDESGENGRANRDRGSETRAESEGEGKAGGEREDTTQRQPGGITEASDGQVEKRNARNHRIGPDDVLVPGGQVARAKANIAAIRLVKQLEEEGREATEAEKKILAQFTGWGSLAQLVFNKEFETYARYDANEIENKNWRDWLSKSELAKYEKWKKDFGNALYPGLGGLLTKEEWKAAAKSTLNAFYTDRKVISAMWKMAERLGFKGGKVLEPSAGSGLFFGLMPENLSRKSHLTGVELDKMTGLILKHLYPDADIQITGFQDAKRCGDNSQDLVISNVPFGDYKVFDKQRPQYADQSIHNYFFSRAIDATKPGGICILLTSHFGLDSLLNAKTRELWQKKADLAGAIRLPGTSFEKAGTQVTTDIVIFRKKHNDGFDAGRPFRNLAEVETPEGKAFINEYFVANPEMVLGKHSLQGSMYGGKDVYALKPDPDMDIEEALDGAIERLPKNVFGVDKSNLKRVQPASEAADEGMREGAMVLGKDGTLGVVQDGMVYELDWAKKKKLRDEAVSYLNVKKAVQKLRVSIN